MSSWTVLILVKRCYLSTEGPPDSLSGTMARPRAERERGVINTPCDF
jgi:hypothetical protein